MRNFDSGATRDVDTNKLDYEGFLSPLVLERYAEYMHKNRVQADGKVRDSDNWQKGIPKEAYMKSMWRHFMTVWKGHREGKVSQDDLAALMFNVMGYLFEELRKEQHITPKTIADKSLEVLLRSNEARQKRLEDLVAISRVSVPPIEHYTHRYGALAHDQEAIENEDREDSIYLGSEDGRITKYKSPLPKGCINYEQDENSGIPGASGLEHG